MSCGISLHDVSEFYFFGKSDVFELAELGAVFDHGVVGSEAHEVVDESENHQTHARSRGVNVDGSVLRLVAILLKILTANSSVVVALETDPRNTLMINQSINPRNQRITLCI